MSAALPFKLVVEQAFTLTGRGTVIVGHGWQGAIRIGDELYGRQVIPRVRELLA